MTNDSDHTESSEAGQASSASADLAMESAREGAVGRVGEGAGQVAGAADGAGEAAAEKSGEQPEEATAVAPAKPSRRRRVPRQRRTFDSTVPSPCISVCTYDKKGMCAGCYRTPDEIRDWIIMDREQKLAVLESVIARRQLAEGD